MRYFRIPNFSGIEAHREDANRGSLTKVQNCIPVPEGGLRSSPQWSTLASHTQVPGNSGSSTNKLFRIYDSNENNIYLVTRGASFHDIWVSMNGITFGNFDLGSDSGSPFSFSNTSEADIGEEGPAYFSRTFGGMALTDGSKNNKGPLFISEKRNDPDLNDTNFVTSRTWTPAQTAGTDSDYYQYESGLFYGCKFFIQGGNHCLFASGNPKTPLTIYVSEPAGTVQRGRRNLPLALGQSETEVEGQMLSKVQLLSTAANKITGLSLDRMGNVLVHTDRGVFQLLPPSSSQGSTGYRTEQRSTSSLSGAINYKTAVGSQESLPYYLGHDGQLYDVNQVTSSPENRPDSSDEDQASWKSKGVWEKEHPDVDRELSFSVYNAEAGIYWLFMPTKGYMENVNYEVGSSGAWAPSNFFALSSPSKPTDFALETGPEKPTDFAAVLLPQEPWMFEGVSTPARPTNLSAGPAKPTSFEATPAKPTNFGAYVPRPSDFSGTSSPAKPTDFAAS